MTDNKTNKHFDYIYKYVVIGEAGVGKTSLARQYVYNDYNDNYNTTIGVDFSCKTVFVEDTSVKIQIWDTAGQEAFRSIINTYFKDTIGVIIVIDDYTNEQLENIKYWQNEYYKKQIRKPTNVFFMVVLNKLDSFHEKANFDLIQNYCNDNNIIFYGVSAKSGCNVNECFRKFTQYIYQQTKNSTVKINGIKKCVIELDKPKQLRYTCCKIV